MVHSKAEVYSEILDWAAKSDETLADLAARIWDLIQAPSVPSGQPESPYGCKCAESPRLVEGRHLSTCPHYSDEGAPPGYPVGHHDGTRGPYPGVR